MARCGATGCAVLAIGFILASPVAANATTYCVQAPGCVGTAESDFANAISAAQTTPTVRDTIVLGPVTHTAPAGGWTVASNNPVDVAGQDRANTILTGPASSSQAIVTLQ